MKGKEVDYQSVRKGKNPKYQGWDLCLVVMPYSKHASIMVNTWGTTHKHQDDHWLMFIIQNTCTGTNLGAMFLMTTKTIAKAISSLTKKYRPNNWDLMQFGFVIAVSQVDSMLVHNFVWFVTTTKQMHDKDVFTKELLSVLIIGGI